MKHPNTICRISSYIILVSTYVHSEGSNLLLGSYLSHSISLTLLPYALYSHILYVIHIIQPYIILQLAWCHC